MEWRLEEAIALLRSALADESGRRKKVALACQHLAKYLSRAESDAADDDTPPEAPLRQRPRHQRGMDHDDS
jgi:hypothetical protein